MVNRFSRTQAEQRELLHSVLLGAVLFAICLFIIGYTSESKAFPCHERGCGSQKNIPQQPLEKHRTCSYRWGCEIHR